MSLPARTSIPLLCALLLGAGSLPAWAANEGAEPALQWQLGESSVFRLPGSLRLSGGHVDPLALHTSDPALPDLLPADDHGQIRLRIQPRFGWRKGPEALISGLSLQLDGELRVSSAPEALAGVLALDPVQQRRIQEAALRLMEARLDLDKGAFRLRAGLSRSHWGAGILAHGGEDASLDLREEPFGVAYAADRMLRLQIFYRLTPPGDPRTGAPFLGVAVATDAVVEDDSASWAEGDRAYHVFAAVHGSFGGTMAGLYAVHRKQEHALGGRSSVGVFDLHLRHRWDRTRIRAWLEAELAAVMGQSTYAQSTVHEGPFSVSSVGGVLRFGLATGAFRAVLETGMASGDDNPYDDQLRSFRFDRSYRVGLLIFGEGLRKASAVAALNVQNPEHRAYPPRALDRIPTGGAVEGQAICWAIPTLSLGSCQGAERVSNDSLLGASC